MLLVYKLFNVLTILKVLLESSLMNASLMHRFVDLLEKLTDKFEKQDNKLMENLVEKLNEDSQLNNS